MYMKSLGGNKMFAIIDCGSVSTKVYILGDNGNILSSTVKNVGVKDTASSGSSEILKQGIKEAILSLIESSKLELSELEFAIAFGMITSEIGLKEIPHIVAPAGLTELADNVEIVHDLNVFPLDIPVIFIRGMKNSCQSKNYAGIRGVDLMRGEETQVIGVLERLKPSLPINILELGSTTKLIHVNSDGKIAGSITSISGQVYDAIKKETFIGKCVRAKQEEPAPLGFFSEEIFKAAQKCVNNAGFLRTMLLTRFSEITLPTKWFELKFFLESAIAADDVKLFDEAENLLGFELDTDFVLVGHKDRCAIYEYIIRQRSNYTKEIVSISDKQEIDMLGITGATKLAEKARKLL